MPFFLRRKKTPTPAPAATTTHAITIPAIAPADNPFFGSTALLSLFPPLSLL